MGNFVLDDDKAFEAGFRQMANELVELVIRKRRDYGSSVGYHGTRGLLPRIADKFFRLDSLVWKNNAANFESASDTARDLAVYSIMLAMGLEWEKQEAMNLERSERREAIGRDIRAEHASGLHPRLIPQVCPDCRMEANDGQSGD